MPKRIITATKECSAYSVRYDKLECESGPYCADDEIIGVSVYGWSGDRYDMPKPNRHCDVIHLINSIGDKPCPSRDSQGFYTDKGTYLTRYKARNLAIANGQCKNPAHRVHLFSEDLW